MMMALLRPLKAEIEAVAARLQQGGDSPESLAAEIIQLVEQLRGDREQWFIVTGLAPHNWAGHGPYPTRATAEKAIAKDLWVTEFGRPWCAVSVRGPAHMEQRLRAADEPPKARGDFAEVALDAKAFKNGWNGKAATRSNYLTT